MSFNSSNFSLISCTLFSPISVCPVLKAIFIFSGETVLVAKSNFTSRGLRLLFSQALAMRLQMVEIFCSM